jgi:hypothetical protein
MTPTLGFDAAVPRTLAHRSSVGEVLPTDTLAIDDSHFLVAAQTPRSHLLFNDGPDRRHDLLVVVETVRQGGTVVAHRFLDMPLDRAFVLRAAEVEVVDADAWRMRPAPSQLVAELRLSDVVRRDGVIARMSAAATVTIDGAVAARGGGAMVAVPLRAYQAVRPPARQRSRPTLTTSPPLSPDRVGRRNSRNVVITRPVPIGDDGSRMCELLVDPAHPHFFDHPQDHVPGTLMVEAYRQAAVAVAADLLVADADDLFVARCSTTFLRYAELGTPTFCTVKPGKIVLPAEGRPTVPLELTSSQGNATVATASLQLMHIPETS